MSRADGESPRRSPRPSPSNSASSDATRIGAGKAIGHVDDVDFGLDNESDSGPHASLWHQLALQVSCPVFTLCHARKLKMSCKSAVSTEIFARSLHRRLKQHISREGGDATTFPPSRALTLLNDDDNEGSEIKEELGNAMRFWSESNLALLKDEGHVEQDVEHDAEGDETQVGEDNDSDLFFDFDIGSPEEENNNNMDDAIINDVSEVQSRQQDQQRQGDVEMVLRRGHSCDSVTSTGDKASTFYGSASSGLCSDLDQNQGHVSLDAAEWDSTHNNGHNDNEQRNNEQTGSNEENNNNEKNKNENGNSSKLEPEEPFSIYSGESRHTVASSKLNELLALLDKDRSVKQQKPTISPRRSIRKNESNEELKLNSPANFSFLSGPSELSCSVPPNEGLAPTSTSVATPATMTRSDSTPELSAAERAAISASESPKPRRKLESPATSAVSIVAEKNENAVVAEDDDNNEVRENNSVSNEQKMRRASSLKTGKTPPGTPGRRKIVRFADVFGLDLADVKTFLDEVPRVPRSAYSDLAGVDLSDIESESDASSTSNPNLSNSSDMRSRLLRQNVGRSASIVSNEPSTSLVPMFNQPGSFPNFFDLLRDKKVCVENAYMAGSDAVAGTIRVQNLSFNKRVLLRYSTNEWTSFSDFEATYVQGSCDGFSDKFTFRLKLSSPLAVGQRLQCCVTYITDIGQFWDNNAGRNYVFQCLSNNSSKNNTNVNKSTNNNATSSAVAIAAPRHVTAYHGVSHSPSALASDEPWMNFL